MEVQRYIIVDWGVWVWEKYVEIKNKAWRKLELLREIKLQEKSLKSFLFIHIIRLEVGCLLGYRGDWWDSIIQEKILSVSMEAVSC